MRGGSGRQCDKIIRHGTREQRASCPAAHYPPRWRLSASIVRFGSKTVLTPLKWDFCFTPESRHRSAYAADCAVIVYYGAAKLADKHLA
jgi:hypothetical protein